MSFMMCSECLKPCKQVWVDFGFGTTEMHGNVSTDVNEQQVSDCCEAETKELTDLPHRLVETGMTPCEFTILKVDDKKVVLQDAGGMTITNAAEHVVQAILVEFPELQIFYYDTEGQYDQLCYDDEGVFTHFKPGPA